MKCPFYEEVKVAYCKGFSVKKMVPLTEASTSCLEETYKNCPIYKNKPLVIEAEKKEEEEKYCPWLREEVVSYRLCTKNYNCEKCEFEQQIADTNVEYRESPEIIEEINKALKLPGYQRRCKYVLYGHPKKIPCNKNYECFRCETYIRLRELITK
jgi:hypothetical protein